jgi:hypothetical protein
MHLVRLGDGPGAVAGCETLLGFFHLVRVELRLACELGALRLGSGPAGGQNLTPKGTSPTRLRCDAAMASAPAYVTSDTLGASAQIGGVFA